MKRGTRGKAGLARATLLAVVVGCLSLVLAAPASAVRSKRGARPSVTILTKDERAMLKTSRLSLRVGVGIPPARVRIRGLGLDLGRRPMRIVAERKVVFRSSHARTYNLKLTNEAKRLIQAARDGCRDVRISAFVASRRYGRKRDDQRTTLVRHSKALKHGRTSGCTAPGVPGAPGIPGSPGSTPGLGGPSLLPFGTAPGPTPVPTDPISIRAGAALGDSTPPVGTPMFAYTARSQVFGPDPNHALQLIADPDENLYAKTFVPSQGIHTRIRARAIVIEAAGKKYALAMVDLGGHPYAVTREVLNRVEGLGITGDRLFLSSTHTHSSSGAIWSADNSGYAFVGGDVYDPRVFEMVVSGIVESITEANKRLQPARIGVGTANLKGASRNREHDPFKLNPEATDAEKASGNEAVDQRVTAIRVDDARGAPIGVWSNFAIHPTSFGDDNLLFSGDNAATTERLVEDEIVRDAAARGAAPAVIPVNVWTNGTEGDVSPDGGTASDASEADANHRGLELSNTPAGGANSAGRKVAGGVVAAWRKAGEAMSGSPTLDARHMFMDFDGREVDGAPTASYPALGAGGIVAGEGPSSVFEGGGCSPVEDVAGPGQGKKFPIVQGPGLAPNQQPISMLRIGPLAVAAWPSEITTVVGRRMKAAINAATAGLAPAGAVIMGLTNSYNSYTATPQEYDFCSYEGSFTLWGRLQGHYYRDLAGGLAKALYAGQPLPAGGSEPPVVSPGTPNQPSVRATPNAKSIVTNTSAVNRLGQSVFKWNGGDPAVDAPRNGAFVTLEYDAPGGPTQFRAVSTEDSVMDTTRHAADDSWTETWQFTECDALGTYRFHVRGKAVQSGPASDYEVISNPFELRRASIKSYSTTVSNGAVHVRAEYEGLPSAALAVLNRRVRHGFAIVRVTRPGGAQEDVIAPIDSAGLEFRASVPNGSTASVLSIEDACGNTGR
jgi:neutral ceramidase